MSDADEEPVPGDPDALHGLETAILAALAGEDERPPAALAMELDEPLDVVLDRIKALQDRGFLERAGFSTCVLTDAGRTVAREAGDTATDDTD